jgi:hypothetical protein
MASLRKERSVALSCHDQPTLHQDFLFAAKKDSRDEKANDPHRPSAANYRV